MTVMAASLRLQCIKVIADYGAVRLTPEQFDELLGLNPKLEKQLIKFDSPSDTMDRESLLSALAIHVVGRDWPTNGAGECVSAKFFEDYKAALIAKGYKLVR